MKMRWLILCGAVFASAQAKLFAGDLPSARVSSQPTPDLERTCFQTGKPWSEIGDLGSDVAIAYGIDSTLPRRIQSWRDHGYRIQVMTGVAWGKYQDYLYGRFDGVNHEDEAQTVSDGRKSTHGGDSYYMCPSTNFGKFLCAGIQRALDAGTEAIHLEEPEFWVNSGYSESFKREWQAYYNEPWQAPQSSVDAQWRASKLKYFLYRRTLQQVFDYVRDYNQRTGRHVRCYVPTHSLLNYADWCIVSPESSLAQLRGCDGYIGQVWTGTARTPNLYAGRLKERTFETAFLEYGAIQNLVRSTGRAVWFLNDPIEDNPNHDWTDYQRNWESTLAASLFQPEVWQFEVAPWPERIFGRRYPTSAKPEDRKPIPPAYAIELQTVMRALNDMKQERVEWDCGTTGVGVLVSDSLMFQRGDPTPSDAHLSQVYGLAMPLLKRGLPVTPVQLENVTLPHFLESYRVLLLTYQGMKPLTPEVHLRLAEWVKRGGVLVVCDDDSDPYNKVREWWNSQGRHYRTPREHLFEQLDFNPAMSQTHWRFGAGDVLWLHRNPAELAHSEAGAVEIVSLVKQAAQQAGLTWHESNYLLLRRGPYIIAAGLDESIPGAPKNLHGRFINLFDPQLRAQTDIQLVPGARYFLRDLDMASAAQPQLLASACRASPIQNEDKSLSWTVEGVGRTPAIVLVHAPRAPRSVTLDGQAIKNAVYASTDKLLWIRFDNEARPRALVINF